MRFHEAGVYVCVYDFSIVCVVYRICLQEVRSEKSVVLRMATSSSFCEVSAKRQRRTWCMEWDVLMCREMLLIRSYQYAKGSKDRTNAWAAITTNLCKHDGFAFTTKSIKDHLDHLLANRKTEINAERKQTGVNTELTEIQVLLDEIGDDMEKEKEIDEGRNEKKRTAEEEEKKKAEDVRKRAMETLSETKKRQQEEGDDISPSSKKRRSGSETMRFLMEKNELAKKEHEETLKLKKDEIEIRRQEMGLMQNSVQGMMQTMQTQIQAQSQVQQQQMQQQFQLQQQQMQQMQAQQMQLFSALIDKLNK